jgi:hypothetical protein
MDTEELDYAAKRRQFLQQHGYTVTVSENWTQYVTSDTKDAIPQELQRQLLDAIANLIHQRAAKKEEKALRSFFAFGLPSHSSDTTTNNNNNTQSGLTSSIPSTTITIGSSPITNLSLTSANGEQEEDTDTQLDAEEAERRDTDNNTNRKRKKTCNVRNQLRKRMRFLQ